MTLYRQATNLRAIKDFDFVSPVTGRRIKVRTGQRFWVTNTQLNQKETGNISVARMNQNMHFEWYFDTKTFHECFENAD